MKTLIAKMYDVCYRSLNYAIGFSSVAGLGNSLSADNISFNEAFGQSFTSQFAPSFLLSVVYTPLFLQFQKSNHYRLYANLYQAGLTTMFLALYYYSGTENPVETVATMSAIAFPMVNKHVSETLEEKAHRLTKHL